MRKIKKSSDAMVFGVCGGIAEYFGIEPKTVRIVWVLLTFFFGSGLLAYLIAALIMPAYDK